MHAKAVVIDGTTRSFWARRFYGPIFAPTIISLMTRVMSGALIHDESLKVEGPAVEHID